MLYEFSGLELPQLQTMKNLCDEGRILIILESVKRVLYSSFQLTYLPFSVELELLLSFCLYLLSQMLLNLLNLLLSFFFLRFLNWCVSACDCRIHHIFDRFSATARLPQFFLNFGSTLSGQRLWWVLFFLQGFQFWHKTSGFICHHELLDCWLDFPKILSFMDHINHRQINTFVFGLLLPCMLLQLLKVLRFPKIEEPSEFVQKFFEKELCINGHLAFDRKLLIQQQVFFLGDKIIFVLLPSCFEELSYVILKVFINWEVVIVESESWEESLKLFVILLVV